MSDAPLFSDGAMYGLMALVFTTLAAIWKSHREQRQQIAMLKQQHDFDVEDRKAIAEANRADREANKVELRETMARDAETNRLRMELATLQQQRDIAAQAGSLTEKVERSVERSARDMLIKVHETADAAHSMAAADLVVQTDALTQVIETTARDTAGKADAAYAVGNSVNAKMEKLHETNAQLALALARQGEVLHELMSVIERRGAARPEPFVERRADDARPVIAIVEGAKP